MFARPHRARHRQPRSSTAACTSPRPRAAVVLRLVPRAGRGARRHLPLGRRTDALDPSGVGCRRPRRHGAAGRRAATGIRSGAPTARRAAVDDLVAWTRGTSRVPRRPTAGRRRTTSRTTRSPSSARCPVDSAPSASPPAMRSGDCRTRRPPRCASPPRSSARAGATARWMTDDRHPPDRAGRPRRGRRRGREGGRSGRRRGWVGGRDAAPCPSPRPAEGEGVVANRGGLPVGDLDGRRRHACGRRRCARTSAACWHGTTRSAPGTARCTRRGSRPTAHASRARRSRT